MFSFLFLHQVYSRSHRVLFVTDSSKDIKSYSQFIEDLESIGCVITQELTSHEEIHLQRFGEKLYDTIIIAGGNSHCFGKKIENLIEFIDEGGNAIIFHGNQSNDIQDLLYANLSIKYQKSQIMSDIFENSSVILRRFVAPTAVVSKDPGPIVYMGSFCQIPRPNEFRFPIYTGDVEHRLPQTARLMKNSVTYGPDMIPIAAFQSRKAGRIVSIHSSTFARDKTFSSKVTRNENYEPISVENGNRQLMLELSQWVTHYKSHVRFTQVTHFDPETKVAPIQYHIKQNVTVVADLVQVKDGEWIPYDGPLQVEIFMLGTFIRRHMKMTKPGHFTETLMLPDRAGNFKIKVFTNKEGWANAREEMAIAIRPLGIREKEKFLECAQPYQISMIMIMIATFLVSVHFLYHKPA